MNTRFENRNPYPFHSPDYYRAIQGIAYRPAPQNARLSNWQVLARLVACCAASSVIALVLLAYFYA